jgi:tetratricopeptide (TPR) repeat protein
MASVDSRLKGDLEILKSQGNKFFSANKFGAAAEKYTEAIALLPPTLSADHVAARASDTYTSGKRAYGSAQDELRPQVSILYSNRAYCYKALGNLPDMQRDAQNALLFDKFNAKVGIYSMSCVIRGKMLAIVTAGSLLDRICPVQS